MAHVHLPVIGQVAPIAGPAGGAIPLDPLLDNFSRKIRYLRVSVTDRCNYRCSYCMPEELGDQLVFESRKAVLSFEELERLVGVFARLGVRKIRLTGGEPTVRKGIVELAGRIARLAGIEQVVMTSNGHLLGELAAPLAAAGVSAINISLDTLDAAKFRALTGRGDLARVLAGVDAAVAAGMRVKINAVALRGVNDGELARLCEYAWSRGALPRFIEHMPMSDGALYAPEAELPAAAIRRALEAAMGPLVPADQAAGKDPGPARYWRVAADGEAGSRGVGTPTALPAGRGFSPVGSDGEAGSRGVGTPTALPAGRGFSPVGSTGREVGIISAMTEHFCGDCNRLRLTATGALHACLGHDDAISLRDVIRRGGSDDDVVRAIAAAVTGKRAGHAFERTGAGAPQKHMIGIGG